MNKVSIVVPIYNAAYTLERCIKSLLEQIYSNIEIILVNDGSSDESINICQSFSKLDSRVLVINKKNEGVSAARNDGIKKATGEFIIFVDSDDYVSEHYISSMMSEYIKDTTLDLVISGFKIISKEITFETKMKSQRLDRKGFYKQVLVLAQNSIGPYAVNKMFKRSIILQENIFFDTSINFAEDHLFNLHYYEHVNFVKIIEEASYFYIKDDTGQSLSSNYKSIFFNSRVLVANKIKGLLFKESLWDSLQQSHSYYYLNYTVLYTLSQLLLSNYDKEFKKIEFHRIKQNLDSNIVEYYRENHKKYVSLKKHIMLNLFLKGNFSVNNLFYFLLSKK